MPGFLHLMIAIGAVLIFALPLYTQAHPHQPRRTVRSS